MSRRNSRGFTRPSSEASDIDNSSVFSEPSKRRANVYDAVAGRVTQAGLIGNITDVKSSKHPLRPDEVLFKQSNAPLRYEETDYYHAQTRLPAGQQLPSGDMLSSIHAYISKLYSRTGWSADLETWKCMDETALIAMGILMEETVREILGETGDLAFLEAADGEETEASSSNSETEDNEETEDDEDAGGLRPRMEVAGGEKLNGGWSSSGGDDSHYSTEGSS